MSQDSDEAEPAFALDHDVGSGVGGPRCVVKQTRTLPAPEDVEKLFFDTPQPTGYRINTNGTFKQTDEEIADERSEQPQKKKRRMVRVISPFKVVRRVEHPDGTVGADCVFIDSKGRFVPVAVSAEEFLGTELLKKLANLGLKVHANREALTALRTIYNQLESEVPTVRVVTRQGAQPSGSIVFDEIVFGNEGDLVVDPMKIRGFSTKGTLEQWIEHVSLPALKSQALTFAISHSFAALLKYGGDLSNGVFNLFGPTSTGKTVGLHVSASTLGRPKTLVGTWLATDAGFEERALREQGWSWFIDEARIGLKNQGEENIIFALAHGRTKSRASSHGGAGVELQLWALSSQEDRENDPCKGQPNDGADLRLFRIPVGYDRDRGVFEGANDIVEAKQMADAIKLASSQYYGSAIPALCLRLLQRGDWRSEIEPRVSVAGDKLRESVSGDAKVGRALDSFALIAAVGEWATELGVTGWKAGDSTKAVSEMFKAYRRGPPTDYWSTKAQAASGSPSDQLAGLIAAIARTTDTDVSEQAADDVLAFLRSEAPVPLGALIADGRHPDPMDRNCPIFVFHRDDQAALICVSPIRLSYVVNGRHEAAARQLKKRGVLVANGQPSSLRYTLKIGQKPKCFYAFSYEKVVGVGEVQP